MHVGLLVYGSLDTISGGFLYDRKLVGYLREAGDRVDVINLPWRHYGVSLLDNLNSGLRRRLRQAAFDVLLEDELVHPSCFWLNQRLRYRLTYPTVAIVHHLRCREQHPAFMTRLYRRVEKSYLASVDGFVCVSGTTQADVEEVVGRARPLLVAYPGRDGLPGAVSRQEIMARATAPGPFQLIFVGNLIPRKELHTLLAALASLPRDDWRLTVAGSLESNAAYVGAIRRQIKDAGLESRVSLLGALPARELAARCAASHLMAVPSSYEGFGIVYLEGMHFGLPAIAGTAGAAKELIRHGHNGFLAPPGDAAALAHAINLLMEDRELLKRMSLTAHRSAAAHPTWNESAAAVRAFLQSFLW
ncbi:MAG: glycosyltransferase family 4 protein [Desulfobaccales bacterium]